MNKKHNRNRQEIYLALEKGGHRFSNGFHNEQRYTETESSA